MVSDDRYIAVAEFYLSKAVAFIMKHQKIPDNLEAARQVMKAMDILAELKKNG